MDVLRNELASAQGQLDASEHSKLQQERFLSLLLTKLTSLVPDDYLQAAIKSSLSHVEGKVADPRGAAAAAGAKQATVLPGLNR